MPVWMRNEGAWIAIGVSVLFVVAGWLMHRVFVRVLKQPPPPHPSSTPAAPAKNPNEDTPP